MMKAYGRPSTLKIKIAKLMRDGRPRTYNDINTALGFETQSRKNSMEYAVKKMSAAGLLVKSNGLTPVIVQSAFAGEAAQ